MSKPTLPLHIKTAWVEALRSGKYNQCKGTLHDSDIAGYCCLGVLQKILDGDVEQYPAGSYRSLPSEDWCGDHWLYYSFWDQERFDLTNLNDNGSSFSEIADIIEREYEGV